MLPSKTQNPPAKSAVKAQIDENLRRVYDEVLTEAIPDRFTALLAQLKAQDPAKAGGPATEASASDATTADEGGK